MVQTNTLGLPIGDPIAADWHGASPPPRTTMHGEHVRLEPLDPHLHASDLYEAFVQDTENRIWTYLPYGPFGSLAEYRAWLVAECMERDPLFFAAVDRASGRAVGVASFLRINPAAGSVEVGHICFAPALQRTIGATEAMYLMMARAFDELGNRRYEWKCDALNEKSCNAACRLGFTFEGIFRQATTYKGRNRDTAWYSVLDHEWPALQAAYRRWLAPANFHDGQQVESLGQLTANANRQNMG